LAQLPASIGTSAREHGRASVATAVLTLITRIGGKGLRGLEAEEIGFLTEGARSCRSKRGTTRSPC